MRGHAGLHVGGTLMVGRRGRGLTVLTALLLAVCVLVGGVGLLPVSSAHAVGGVSVFFDANGGSFTGGLSRKSVSSDATGVVTASQISGVGEPSNTGYTFDGWYSTAQGGEKLNTSEGLIVEYSQSWYAHWKRTSTSTPTGNVSVTIQTGGAPFGSYVFPGSSVTHSFPSWNWAINRYGGKMLSAPESVLNNRLSKNQASLTVSDSDSYKLDLLPYTPLNTAVAISGGRIHGVFQEDVLFWVAQASGESNWTVLAPIGGSGTSVDLSAYAGKSVTLQPVTRRAVRTGSGIVDKTNPLLPVVLNPDGGSWPDGSTGNKSVEGPVFASTATGASQNTALTPQAGSLDQKYLRGGASAPSKNGLPLYDWSGLENVWSDSATLKARYGYRVSLNGNGGTFPDGNTSKSIFSGENVTQPTREHYTFMGWNTEANGNGTSYPAGSTTVPVTPCIRRCLMRMVVRFTTGTARVHFIRFLLL